MEKVAAILAAILIVTSWVEADDAVLHKEMKVEENTTLTLFCPGFFGPNPNDSVSSIKWFKDKVLVATYQNTSGKPFIGFPKYNGRIYYEATNSSIRDGGLVINPAIQVHEGLYRCDVKTDNTMLSGSLHLHVVVPNNGPVIRGLDTPILAGKDAILACTMEVDSNSEVIIQWYFHDDNSTAGELIRKESRYGVDRVTSVALYSPEDPTNVNDVTCVVLVNNISYIATHEVNVLFEESGYPRLSRGSTSSLSLVFGLISLIIFLLFLFREWQWRRYVKKIQDRTVLTVEIPTGWKLDTVLFPGFQGKTPFFKKIDSVNSQSSQKQLLSKKPENTNSVQKQNSLLSNHTEVTIQSDVESDSKNDVPTIKNGTGNRISMDKPENGQNRTSSSEC